MTIIGIAMMGIDKKLARTGARRISEKTLFLVALIGGSVGIWIGMYVFRHKTKHIQFVMGIPIIIIIQAYCLYRRL